MKPVLLILQSMLSWFVRRLHVGAMWIFTIVLALSTPSCAPSPEFRGGPLCDTTQDRPGFPSCLPPSNALFCERDAPKVAAQNKALVGQSVFTLQPASAQPRCVNREQVFTELEIKIVREGATQSGQQFGAATFHCHSALESLDQQTDHHLAPHQKANQKAVQIVLDNCQRDFEAVPMIPAYESPELRRRGQWRLFARVRIVAQPAGKSCARELAHGCVL